MGIYLNICHSCCMSKSFCKIGKKYPLTLGSLTNESVWRAVLLALGLALLGCPPLLQSHCLLPVHTVLSPAALVSGVLPYSVLCLCDSYTVLILVLSVGRDCVCSCLFHQLSSSGHSFVHAVTIHWSPTVVLGTLLGAGCWLEGSTQPWRQPWFLPLWSLPFSEERY